MRSRKCLIKVEYRYILWRGLNLEFFLQSSVAPWCSLVLQLVSRPLPISLSLSLSFSLSLSLSHSLSLSNNCARSQIALRRISKLVYFMGGITTAVQYAGLCRISRMERFAKIFYQYLYNVYYYFKYYLYFQKSYIFS